VISAVSFLREITITSACADARVAINA